MTEGVAFLATDVPQSLVGHERPPRFLNGGRLNLQKRSHKKAPAPLGVNLQIVHLQILAVNQGHNTHSAPTLSLVSN